MSNARSIADILTNFADQATAETGTNNTKFMSPLRTRQAAAKFGLLTPVVETDSFNTSALDFTLDTSKYGEFIFYLTGAHPTSNASVLMLQYSVDNGATWLDWSVDGWVHDERSPYAGSGDNWLDLGTYDTTAIANGFLRLNIASTGVALFDGFTKHVQTSNDYARSVFAITDTPGAITTKKARIKFSVGNIVGSYVGMFAR